MRADGAQAESDHAPAQTWLEWHAVAVGAWLAKVAAAHDADALGAFLQLEGSLVVQAALRLRALGAMLPAPPSVPAEGRWIGIAEVARLTHRSISWIRHAPRESIPGRRAGPPGTRAEWWEPAVKSWLQALAGPGRAPW